MGMEDYAQKVKVVGTMSQDEKDETYQLPASGGSPNFIKINLGEKFLSGVDVVLYKDLNADIALSTDTTEDDTEKDTVLATTDPQEFISADPLPQGFARSFDRKDGMFIYIVSREAAAVDKAVGVLKKYHKKE